MEISVEQEISNENSGSLRRSIDATQKQFISEPMRNLLLKKATEENQQLRLDSNGLEEDLKSIGTAKAVIGESVGPLIEPKALSAGGYQQVSSIPETVMKSTAKMIGGDGRKIYCSLRQINIVGQLNHSANGGLLLLINLLMVLCLLVATFDGVYQPAEAVVWPFSSARLASPSTNGLFGSSLWPSINGNKGAKTTDGTTVLRREPRDSGQAPMVASGKLNAAGGTKESPVGPIATQQFHYFWNHDQIEPKLVEKEASKILNEAQMQTDKMALSNQGANDIALSEALQAVSSMGGPSQQQSKQARHDSVQGFSGSASASQNPTHFAFNQPEQPQILSGQPVEPIVMPPAIQQQLTALVLQLQRQQQMSMLMQPRFAHDQSFNSRTRRFAPGVGGAQMQLSPTTAPPGATPFNPMGRYWMSSSSQHPVIVAPPMFASESMQAQQQAMMGNPMFNQFGASMTMAPAASQQRSPAVASVAGVPVYGPFMVAPSVVPVPQALLQHQHQHQHHQHQHQNMNHSPSAGAPSTASARSTGSGSGSGSSAQPVSKLASTLLGRRKPWPLFGLTDRGSSLFASASQLRPTVAVPPASISGSSSSSSNQPALASNPDAAALLDLANAITNQLQLRTTQQKLATAIAQLFEQQDLQSAASSSVPNLRQTHTTGGSWLRTPAGQDQAATLSTSSPSAAAAATAFMNLQIGQKLADMLPPYMASAQHQLLAANQNPNLIYGPLESVAAAAIATGLAMVNATNAANAPFGSRLKRRHLNTIQQQSRPANGDAQKAQKQTINSLTTTKRVPNPPYSLLADENELLVSHQTTSSPSSKSIASGQTIRANQGEQNKQASIVQYYSNQLGIDQSSFGDATSSKKVVNSGTAAAVGKPTASRIVKKDAPQSELKWRSNKKTAPSTSIGFKPTLKETSATKELRHLFMMSPTESFHEMSQSTDDDKLDSLDVEEQTQLRRLKRSLLVDPDTKLAKSFKPITKSSAWISIDPLEASETSSKSMMIATNVVPPTSQRPQLESSLNGAGSPFSGLRLAGGWSAASVDRDLALRRAIDVESAKSKPLMRRTTESTQESGSKIGLTTASSAPEATSPSSSSSAIGNKQAQANQQSQQSIKVKRIAASASMLHHPAHNLRIVKEDKRQFGKPQTLLVSNTPVSESDQSEMSSSSTTLAPTEIILARNNVVDGEQQQQQQQQQQQLQADFTAGSDPMSASLAESTRVANYFQNVDSESNSQQAPETSKQQQQQQANKSQQPTIRTPQTVSVQGQKVPEVNVGFAAPTKTISSSADQLNSASQVNETSQLQANYMNGAVNDIRRHPVHQQQVSGSSLTTGRQSGNGNVIGGGLSFGGPYQVAQAQASQVSGTSNGNQRQRYLANLMSQAQQRQQHQQQQQLVAAANSADISSAATGNLAYRVNGMLAAPPPGFESGQAAKQARPSFVGTSGQLAKPFGQAGNANDAHRKQSADGFTPFAFINNLFGGSNFDRGIQRSSTSSSSSSSLSPSLSSSSSSASSSSSSSLSSSPSSSQPMTSDSGSNSYNRNTVVAPDSNNNKPDSQSSGSFDRTTSADQSNNYNDESASPVAQQNNQNVYSMSDFQNQSPSQAERGNFATQSQQQSYGNSLDSSLQAADQQASLSDSMNYGTRGVNNNGATNSLDMSNIFGGQVEGQTQAGEQQFNQTTSDNNFGVSDSPLDSSFYGPSSSGPFSQSSLFQSGLQNSDSPLNNQPLMAQQQQQQQQQQQLYSQQLQALGAAVSNYNQQRVNFNQQPQTRAIFSPVSEAQAMRNNYHAMSSHHSNQMFAGMPIDEEAAAGAAAAAGIPSYPTAAQLLAIQTQGQLNEMNGMLMAGSEKREQGEDGEHKSTGQKKGNKKKGYKQISHHYHFNSFGAPVLSPFEDPDNPLGSLDSPLEIANSIGGQQARQKAKANKEEEEEQEKEKAKKEQQEEQEEKPKKKRLLRRFSLKNLFKKLRKDKKKEKGSEESKANDE